MSRSIPNDAPKKQAKTGLQTFNVALAQRLGVEVAIVEQAITDFQELHPELSIATSQVIALCHYMKQKEVRNAIAVLISDGRFDEDDFIWEHGHDNS